MKLPQSIAKKLEHYPRIISRLELAYRQPQKCLPDDYQVKKLEIFCDQKLLFRWVNGYLTHDNTLPETYIPKIIEWFIDGDLVLLVVEKKAIFNRLKNRIDNLNVNIPVIKVEVNYV